MKQNVTKSKFEQFLRKYCSEEWCTLTLSLANLRTYKKNERIFIEGTKVQGMHFINDGKVKIVTAYDDKNERILRFSNSGDWLGHRAIFSEQYSISALALDQVEVYFIPKKNFLNLLRANPNFSMYLIQFIAQELHDAEDRMKNIIHNEVIIRLGIIICMLIDAYGYNENEQKKLSYTLSRTDMANFAGTTYETVIRNLTKLEELKLIRIEKKQIYVLKENELRKFVSKPSRMMPLT